MVNFSALSTRLVRTWQTRVLSPMTVCGTRGSTSQSSVTPLSPARSSCASTMSLTSACRSKSAWCQNGAPGLDPGEVEQGFHEGQQLPAVPIHPLQELELEVVQRGVAQDLARGEHGGQRSADLVTHVGQEHRLRLRGREGGIAGELQLLCQGLEVADATGPLHGDPGMRGERLEDLDILGPERLLLEGPVTHHQHVPGRIRSSQRSGEPVTRRGQQRWPDRGLGSLPVRTMGTVMLHDAGVERAPPPGRRLLLLERPGVQRAVLEGVVARAVRRRGAPPGRHARRA